MYRGFEKCNNVNLPSDKNQQDKESGLQIFVDMCKVTGLGFLSVLVLGHVFFFLVVSFIALDLERYFHFLLDSIIRFYQFFGYAKNLNW